MFIKDAFSELMWSQALLSPQLPITVFLLIGLTGSRRVMGAHANSPALQGILLAIGAAVTVLDLALLAGMQRFNERTAPSSTSLVTNSDFSHFKI